MAKFDATIKATLVKTITGDLADNATIVTVSTTLTVPGVKAGQMYLVALADSDLDANLLLGNGVLIAEADDQLVVRTVNPTVGAINPAPATFYIVGL